MFSLKRIFQSKVKCTIVNGNRKFITQFNLFIPKKEAFNKQEIQVIVYLLSDMILVSRVVNEFIEIY